MVPFEEAQQSLHNSFAESWKKGASYKLGFTHQHKLKPCSRPVVDTTRNTSSIYSPPRGTPVPDTHMGIPMESGPIMLDNNNPPLHGEISTSLEILDLHLEQIEVSTISEVPPTH